MAQYAQEWAAYVEESGSTYRDGCREKGSATRCSRLLQYADWLLWPLSSCS